MWSLHMASSAQSGRNPKARQDKAHGYKPDNEDQEGKKPFQVQTVYFHNNNTSFLRISRARAMAQPFDLGGNGIVVNPPSESDLIVDGYQRIGQKMFIDGLDDILILLSGLRLGQIKVLDFDSGAVVVLQQLGRKMGGLLRRPPWPSTA